jgi:hypothetical protein
MVLVKILKRRDASSIVVAIVIAMIISQPLNMLTSPLAGHIMGLKEGQYLGYAPPNSGWEYYAYEVLWAVLQLIFLEVLAWAYIWAANSSKKK